MNNHVLKIYPCFFIAKINKEKRFEIRWNVESGFQKGDTVDYWEWNPYTTTGGIIKGYTGRMVNAVITFVTSFEQKNGFVVFGDHITSKVFEGQEPPK